MSKIKLSGLIGGLIGFFFLMNMEPPEGLSKEGWMVLVTGMLMAVWWMTEAIPIPVTAMIPLIAFPILDLGDIKEAGKGFASSAVFLTLGGFIIGIALQRWNLHVRVAMHTVRLVGSEPRRVIGGFMLATALLSMWITNTATTVMMMPIALSVAMLLMDRPGSSEEAKSNFGTALMIGLAYAASVGGMMTLVGTSTNVMFKGYFEETYGLDIGFFDWMKIGVPVGLTLLVFIWWFLTRVMFPCAISGSDEVRSIVHGKLEALGRMSAGERRTGYVFIFTASLWIFKDILESVFPWLHLDDASIAILGATLLFVIPADIKNNEFLLRWKDTEKVPWGILLLLGGGLTLASFMEKTGVADWMGQHLSDIDGVSIIVLVLATTLLVTFLSEMMSNVATLTAFLPVIIAISLAFGENPLLFAIPAALAASCAFMLPIGTPPNAIVFGSGLIEIKQMVRTGVLLNFLAIGIINLMCYLLLPHIFGVEHGVMPDWAISQH